MNIRGNLKYLRVVLTHKWYVLRFGWGTVPLWRLLIHDYTKFSRAEWPAYVQRFASGRAGKEDKTQDTFAFRDAWRHHWTHNAHHWEYWREGGPGRGWTVDPPVDGAHPMPYTYIREMVADWRAASKAYSGKNDCTEWYLATRERQVMHPTTCAQVEHLLGIA